MKTKNKNLMTLEEFKEKNYGKRGTKERDELESGYENFKIGALIHDARIEKGIGAVRQMIVPNSRWDCSLSVILTDRKPFLPSHFQLLQ